MQLASKLFLMLLIPTFALGKPSFSDFGELHEDQCLRALLGGIDIGELLAEMSERHGSEDFRVAKFESPEGRAILLIVAKKRIWKSLEGIELRSRLRSSSKVEAKGEGSATSILPAAIGVGMSMSAFFLILDSVAIPEYVARGNCSFEGAIIFSLAGWSVFSAYWSGVAYEIGRHMAGRPSYINTSQLLSKYPKATLVSYVVVDENTSASQYICDRVW